MYSEFIDENVDSLFKIDDKFIEIVPPTEIDIQKAVDQIDRDNITRKIPNAFMLFQKQVYD